MTLIEDDSCEYYKDLTEKRSHLVVKSNDLIQKARFTLSLQEQKIILYLISKVKPDDDDFIYQEFSIGDFCRVYGMDHDSGKNYKNVKDAIKALSDKSVWVMLDSGTETLVRWINKAWINKKSGSIRIRLDDDMRPYLLQLRERFTQYELMYTLAMKSQYSIRLFELLRSYEHKKIWVFEIDELKRLLSAENYTRFPDFKRKVLDIAIREINAFSDLDVSCKPKKVGRRFGKIEFTIRLKQDMGERMNTWARIEEVINPAQMSLFDKMWVEYNGKSRKDSSYN